MAFASPRSKLYHLFTQLRDNAAGERAMAGFLAIAMFVALFGFGKTYFGWPDPDGEVSMALFVSFILGCIAGFKSRG